MISIEEKLSHLSEVIKEDLIDKSSKDYETIKTRNDKELAKYKDNIESKLKTLDKEYESKYKFFEEKCEFKAQKDGEQLIAQSKSKIKTDFLKSLGLKLKELYKAPVGEIFLKNNLANLKDNFTDEFEIYLSQNCFERDKKIISETFKQVDIKTSDEIKFGGFIAENISKTYRINASLDYLLESHLDSIIIKFNELLTA